jgi:hypothetical protein
MLCMPSCQPRSLHCSAHVPILILHSIDGSDTDVSVEQALKEVYLPESGVWIAKYPFVDRDVFLDISLDIARERQSQ